MINSSNMTDFNMTNKKQAIKHIRAWNEIYKACKK